METFGLLSFLLLVLHTSADGPVPGLVNEIIHGEKALSWFDAKAYCLDHFGQPFVATDKNDLKILSSPANQLSWMGLYRSFPVWYWVDETLSNYFNWFGKCEQGLNWYTTTCDNKLFFVCKKVSGGWVLVREKKLGRRHKNIVERITLVLQLYLMKRRTTLSVF